ncbi:adenosylhomocysteinase, partial [Candidatus Berkelbacteria bacterium]|nr:adenosylhomocysteinase [Candidatus Berkelbacteria bacterium]
MGALMRLKEGLANTKPFKGLTIGCVLHDTKETANLVRTLEAAGAYVVLGPSNPLSTQDDVVAALAKSGTSVFAWKGMSKRDYYQALESVIGVLKSQIAKSKSQKIVTIDDGLDLVSLIHSKYQDLIPSIIGGAEETTTGVNRLRAMVADGALKYPMVAVNDSRTKHLMDNYIGTGQSTIDGILRATGGVLLAGKVFVVAGFGECGKGVAARADGMGARVVVVEVDPFRALQATMEGYEVMTMTQAAKVGDMFVTVTGNKHVISAEHIKLMKDGALIANAGHFDIEIDVVGLHALASKVVEIRPQLQEFYVPTGMQNAKIKNQNGNAKFKKIYLLGEGRLVNLAAAEGHPSTIMAMSFANQTMAVDYLLKNEGKLAPDVYVLPRELDDRIAKLQLESMGITIDAQTREQKHYSESWRHGT